MKRLLVSAAALATALAGSVAFVRGSLPKVNGTVPVVGLDGPISIDRDRAGIPHIRATSDRDLFFAQGWCLAQDRRWQLDTFHRLCAGTLSEIAGPTALDSDRLMRTVGLRRIAEAQVVTLSDESRMALEAYARGVNAYTRMHPRALSIEFRLMPYAPKEWDAAASIAFFRYMDWQLSVHMERIAAVGRCRDILPLEVFEVIFGARLTGHMGAPPVLDPEVEEAVIEQARRAQKSMAEIAGAPTYESGSNAWAVAGSRTRSGKPLLAGDPHLRLAAPAIWYEVGLDSPSYHVTGGSLPGLPGVIIGRTRETAWSITASMLITSDLYVEEVHPENPHQYRVEDGWRDFDEHVETIHVKGRPDERLTVRSTRHGPVVSPVMAAQREVLALRWVGAEPGDELAVLLGMARARSWDEAREALRTLVVPALNIVYADTSGSIGYQLAGRYPIRQGGGLAPVPGHRSPGDETDHEWRGWIPFDALPATQNPPSGIIASANTRMVGAAFPFELTGVWEPHHRLKRILALLKDRHDLTIDDMRVFQADVHSGRADVLLPRLLEVLAVSEDTDLRWASDELREWSGDVAADSVAATLFNVWHLRCVETILAQRLTPQQVDVTRRLLHMAWGEELWLWTEDQILYGDTLGWFHDDPDVVLRDTMLATVRWLEEHMGRNRGHWTWGRLHTLTFKHPLGDVAVFRPLFNRGPYPMHGDSVTISAAVYEPEQSFDTIAGSSYRLLVDLGDMESSLSIMSLGQSGQIASRHYADQIAPWMRHGYHPMALAARAVVRQRVSHLILEPGLPSASND